jgi:hypothetical protein
LSRLLLRLELDLRRRESLLALEDLLLLRPLLLLRLRELALLLLDREYELRDLDEPELEDPDLLLDLE